MNLHDEIAKVAHELFVRDGRKHGLDFEHWIEAEKIVKARHEKQKKAAATDGKVKKDPEKLVEKKAETVKAGAKKTTSRAKKAK